MTAANTVVKPPTISVTQNQLASAEPQEQIPLSFTQERLWLLDQLTIGRAAYHVLAAFRFEGLLDLNALIEGIKEVVRRHSILRTVFPRHDSYPVQAVTPFSAGWSPAIIDLSVLPVAERQVEAQRLINQAINNSFDLQYGPLFYAKLLRCSANENILLLSAHQTIMDEASPGLFMQELARCYNAFSTANTPTLPKLTSQYADVAIQQRQQFRGEWLDQCLAWWQAELNGVPFVLELPADFLRPQMLPFRGEMHHFSLPTALSERLRRFSRQERVQVSAILLAAFNILLHRYSGQQDLLVGTPISTRAASHKTALIGPLTNIRVVRTSLANEMTFAELVVQVDKAISDAEDSRDLPFEQLIEAVQPERDPSRSPLVQVIFDYQDDTAPLPEFAGLQVQRLPIAEQPTPFDLTLSLRDSTHAIEATIRYAVELFEAATIIHMAGHFMRLLEGALATPEHRLFELPLLTVAERNQLLVEWNATDADYPRHLCVHHLFEAQVERTPDEVAVVFGDHSLTYRELDSQANQIAHYLKKCGVGPDVLVGVCVERSLDIVVALLAVLKAGGAYVPLDPAFPKDRLAYILADAQAAVLLTHHHLLPMFPDYESRALCLDTDRERVLSEPIATAVSEVDPHNLMYVIYTSGSTGKPKGVQLEHRSVVNFLYSMQQQPGLTQADRLLAVTTISFDIAVLELFLPLMVGGQIILASRAATVDGEELVDLLSRFDISIMQATPATWRLLLEANWVGKQDLKILCGGEPLPRDLADQLVARCASLWNMYGPTETTVWSTTGRLKTGDRVVSVGRPIANTQIYLLDAHMQPVPIGIAGDLYIGGDGLARGYLNRPELTAERFIPDLFSEKPGARLYKTGDLARYLPDGSLDFIGRSDFQVKVRGFRIELGEIEAVLSQHPNVQQSVVIVREDVPGDKRLVAYFIARRLPGPAHAELRDFLKTQLPDYMIPSAFVAVEAFPLTPNRKIDRLALPAPNRLSTPSDKAFIAPRTPAEKKLAEIWADVLGLKKISIHDNFFESGGHSLLAIRMFSRIDRQFKQQLPLGTLFQAPTVAQLAHLLEADEQADSWSALIPIQPHGTKPPFFCVAGGVIHMRNLADYLGDDQPLYALQTEALEDRQLAHAELDKIASEALKEIRTVQPQGPYYLGGCFGGGSVALAIAQQLVNEGEDVGLLVAFNTLLRRRETPFWKRAVRRLKSVLHPHPVKIYRRLRDDVDWENAGEYVMGMIWRIAFKFYQVIGRPMPRFLRTGYFGEMLLRQAANSYKPANLYNRPITLFVAQEWYDSEANDPTWGWSKLTTDEVAVQVVPGDPCTIFSEPNVPVSAHELKIRLDRAYNATRE